jgi:hypothetical protein
MGKKSQNHRDELGYHGCEIRCRLSKFVVVTAPAAAAQVIRVIQEWGIKGMGSLMGVGAGAGVGHTL